MTLGETSANEGPLTDAWLSEHFDHLSPRLGDGLHEVLGRMRAVCPVTKSDQHGGFWAITRYEDVLRVTQDWGAFSSELGFTVPARDRPLRVIPMGVDPPAHRIYRRIVNEFFTPAVVAGWEPGVRALVNRLVDRFIDDGRCEFMSSFAQPFPGLAFFEFGLHAPAEELEEVNRLAVLHGSAHTPEGQEAVRRLAEWVAAFAERRRTEAPKGDVVDAVLSAEIDGKAMPIEDAVATIHLLILGGIETTAGVLGMAMVRLCEQPEIANAIRTRPELIPAAVEEFLRLDNSVSCIGRTARVDAEIDGHRVQAGEKVLVSFSSANRDETEFEGPDEFVLGRQPNRHLTFGAGPHRCAGSNVARLNLRVAIGELVRRLRNVQLEDGVDIQFHQAFNRTPHQVPITFTAC